MYGWLSRSTTRVMMHTTKIQTVVEANVLNARATQVSARRRTIFKISYHCEGGVGEGSWGSVGIGGFVTWSAGRAEKRSDDPPPDGLNGPNGPNGLNGLNGLTQKRGRMILAKAVMGSALKISTLSLTTLSSSKTASGGLSSRRYSLIMISTVHGTPMG